MASMAITAQTAAKSHGAQHENAPSSRLVRGVGLLYLVLAVFGMFSVLTLESLVVHEDASETVRNISESLGLFGASLVTWVLIVTVDVAVSVGLYLLLRRINPGLALVTAAFRLVYSAMVGAMLMNLFDAYMLIANAEYAAALSPSQVEAMVASRVAAFGTGFLLALVFFGIHLVLLGSMFRQSRIIPQVIGVLLTVAGFGYIADSMLSFFVENYGDMVTMVLLAPAILGEFGLMLWLIFRGVRTPVTGNASATER